MLFSMIYFFAELFCRFIGKYLWSINDDVSSNSIIIYIYILFSMMMFFFFFAELLNRLIGKYLWSINDDVSRNSIIYISFSMMMILA